MRQRRVAHRYAEALLVASLEDKVEEQVAADVDLMKATIGGSRELLLVLRNPAIKHDVKKEILRSIFAGKVGAVTLEFVSLVAEKGRESALPEIFERFSELRDDRLGNVTVSVSSGSELSADQSAALRQRFSDLTKKNVRLTTTVDTALMGGFLARVGDTVFDGTIKRQLEILRQRFLEGNGTH